MSEEMGKIGVYRYQMFFSRRRREVELHRRRKGDARVIIIGGDRETLLHLVRQMVFAGRSKKDGGTNRTREQVTKLMLIPHTNQYTAPGINGR
jgi:hypothetical protein